MKEIGRNVVPCNGFCNLNVLVNIIGTDSIRYFQSTQVSMRIFLIFASKMYSMLLMMRGRKLQLRIFSCRHIVASYNKALLFRIMYMFDILVILFRFNEIISRTSVCLLAQLSNDLSFLQLWFSTVLGLADIAWSGEISLLQV